jgi:hypothetical protein
MDRCLFRGHFIWEGLCFGATPRRKPASFIGLFNNDRMQGPLNRWKLESYEVKKFGEAEPNDCSLLLQASKLLNIATSL